MRIVFIATDQSVAIKIPKSSTEREAAKARYISRCTYIPTLLALAQSEGFPIRHECEHVRPGRRDALRFRQIFRWFSSALVRLNSFTTLAGCLWSPQIWDRTERSKTYEEVVYGRHVWYFSQRHITGNDMMANSVDSAKHLNRSFPRTAWWLRGTFYV